jgi:DNA gyrase subunit B
VLPIRGKILNVASANAAKIGANTEVADLIQALGCGTRDRYNPAGLRYERVIIMADADVDGSHIRILFLTFFFRYMRDLAETGKLYIAQPPLYQVTVGKNSAYVYSDAELEKVQNEMLAARQTKLDTKKKPAAKTDEESIETTAHVSIQRYKGLGEMNPEQLSQTTMDPAKRILKQVNIGDAKSADVVFDVLMGSEVGPRKKYIQLHAKNVKNLDI